MDFNGIDNLLLMLISIQKGSAVYKETLLNLKLTADLTQDEISLLSNFPYIICVCKNFIGFTENALSVRFTYPDHSLYVFKPDVLNSLIKLKESHSTIYKKRSLRKISCCICMDNEVCIVLKPCRHTFICTDCSKTLINCPICNNFIEEKEQVYVC